VGAKINKEDITMGRNPIISPGMKPDIILIERIANIFKGKIKLKKIRQEAKRVNFSLILSENLPRMALPKAAHKSQLAKINPMESSFP
jgi:hypothetical protein